MYTHTFKRSDDYVIKGNLIGNIYTWRGLENVFKGERKGLFVMGDRAFPNYLTGKQYKKVIFHDSFHRNLFLNAREIRKEHTLNTYPITF